MCRRTTLVTLLVGLFALAFVAPAFADDTKPVRIAGKLIKIDGQALTITADDGSGDTVITCNDATKVKRDGAGEAKFTDLQVGQTVRAYYSKVGNIASAVFIAKAP